MRQYAWSRRSMHPSLHSHTLGPAVCRHECSSCPEVDALDLLISMHLNLVCPSLGLPVWLRSCTFLGAPVHSRVRERGMSTARPNVVRQKLWCHSSVRKCGHSQVVQRLVKVRADLGHGEQKMGHSPAWEAMTGSRSRFWSAPPGDNQIRVRLSLAAFHSAREPTSKIAGLASVYAFLCSASSTRSSV